MSAAVAVVLFTAAITPGPNNFLVMDAARTGGLRAAIAPILGVVIGTLVLVTATGFGLTSVTNTWPTADVVMRVVGFLLLAYLAFRTLQQGWQEPDLSGEPPSRQSAHTFLAMALFQVVNPKSWILAVAVVAANGESGSLSLAAMVAAIPAACLALWAFAGRALATVLRVSFARKAFAVIMAAALFGFSVFVLVGR